MIVTPTQLKRRAELYHQLGSMISAGVPLIKALEMVADSPAIRASRSTVLGLIHYLQSGLTFTESMTRVHGWMPEFDIALLASGEESGRLDGSFRLLSSYYDARAKIIRDMLAGLLTTMATLHVFFLVFPLAPMIAFVQGIMSGDYARCFPFLIQKLVLFGSIYAGVFLLIFACQGKRGEAWRAFVESITQMIPILRTAQKYLVLSRLAGALEATTSAGVSLIKGWDLAAAASGSPHLRRKISGWKHLLESGATQAELISQTGYFPEMFANLYSTAELSGRIDDALHRLQVYYQEEGFRALRFFTRIMNGIIYGLVVLLIAYNVIEFYVGYYKQAGQIMDGF